MFGALAFALCDPLFIHLGNLNLIAVLSWLPWILAVYVRALESARWGTGWRSGWGWAALAGVLLAVSSYAGHAQSTLYVGLALALYTVGWLVQTWLAPDPQVGLRTEQGNVRTEHAGGAIGPECRRVVLHALALGVAVVVTAVLLMGPILLPALEMTRYTVRAEFTYQDAVAYSLAPVQALVGLVTPGFFGRGPALHWSLWERVELPYLGVPTLILAVAGLLLAGRERRRWLWVWLGMAIFGLLLSLGVYGIVHGLLTWLLPFFDQFRAPARALILWALGMCVLAAVGFDLALGRTLDNMSLRRSDVSGDIRHTRFRCLCTLGCTAPGDRGRAAELPGTVLDASRRDGISAGVAGFAGISAGTGGMAGDMDHPGSSAARQNQNAARRGAADRRAVL